MKIHLKIIYGCDDRYNLVKEVIPLCKDYWDSITIYNCGVREFTDKFTNLPSNCRVEYYDGFFGDMESVMRGMMQSVPEGEWFMWLDADERPSQLMLDNIRADTDYLEAHNYNSCRYPSAGHEGGMIWQNLHALPDYETYISGKHTTYAARKYLKKDRLYITSNFGAHYDFWSASGDRAYYFPHYVDHMKSKAQYHQACALKSYTNPLNDSKHDKHAAILASPEFSRLRAFQRETGVITSPQLFVKVNVEKDAAFIAKYSALMASFKDSSIWTFKQMAGLVDYGMNFDTVAYYCGRECCKYGDKQL